MINCSVPVHLVQLHLKKYINSNWLCRFCVGSKRSMYVMNICQSIKFAVYRKNQKNDGIFENNYLGPINRCCYLFNIANQQFLSTKWGYRCWLAAVIDSWSTNIKTNPIRLIQVIENVKTVYHNLNIFRIEIEIENIAYSWLKIKAVNKWFSKTVWTVCLQCHINPWFLRDSVLDLFFSNNVAQVYVLFLYGRRGFALVPPRPYLQNYKSRPI